MQLKSLPALALLVGGVLAPGTAAAREPFVEGQTWGLEVGLGLGWTAGSSAYTRTLETFGFENRLSLEDALGCCWNNGPPRFRFSGAVERIVLPYFSVLLQTNLLDREKWYRDSGVGEDDVFTWSSWTLDVHARAFLPVRKWFRVYAQFGVGPTFDAEQTKYREVDVGYNVAGLGGLELTLKHAGFYVQGGYIYSPSPKNRFGDAHQSGGGILLFGLSAHFGRSL
jgi:hypothetical protein